MNDKTENQNTPESFRNLQKGTTILKEGFEQGAYEFGGKVKDELNKGKEQAISGLHLLEEQTKANPLKAIGISFLIGLVLSKLLNSTR